jgi:hypothetical protein
MSNHRRSWLRRAVLAWGVLYLVGAAALAVRHLAPGLALYLAVGGVLLVAGIIGERSRYRPRVDLTRGAWQPTGERFVDPTSGHVVEVRDNPATGQRAYVDVDPAPTLARPPREGGGQRRGSEGEG